MSLKEIEEIEHVIRADPRRYHRDAAMQKKYRDLLAETPQHRMSNSDMHVTANEHEAADKVMTHDNLSATGVLDGMDHYQLFEYRNKQLHHRSEGESYRRLIADNEERDARDARERANHD